jgi:hypothetical protein
MFMSRFSVSINSMIVLVAILTAALYWVTDRWRQWRERCFELASREAAVGAEYRRNSRGDRGMLESADWHEQISKEYLREATWPWAHSPVKPVPP